MNLPVPDELFNKAVRSAVTEWLEGNRSSLEADISKMKRQLEEDTRGQLDKTRDRLEKNVQRALIAAGAILSILISAGILASFQGSITYVQNRVDKLDQEVTTAKDRASSLLGRLDTTEPIVGESEKRAKALNEATNSSAQATVELSKLIAELNARKSQVDTQLPDLPGKIRKLQEETRKLEEDVKSINARLKKANIP
jgi:chromosome segregation ATPase